jgi:phosphatidylinositol-bisphosphatase
MQDPNSHYDKNLQILNHEYVFWFGDLNYRISEEIDSELIFDQSINGEWEELKVVDQLNTERMLKNVFRDFEEGSLTFAPTYKYQPGTDFYENRPNFRLRAPAWCDRVLWRSINPNAVKLLQYRRSILNSSDHKPVSAVFLCDIRKVVNDKLKNVYQELLCSMDKWLNASSPKLLLDNRIIDMGIVDCNVYIFICTRKNKFILFL